MHDSKSLYANKTIWYVKNILMLNDVSVTYNVSDMIFTNKWYYLKNVQRSSLERWTFYIKVKWQWDQF